MEASDGQPNPYVGPVPFLGGQKLYGREKETDELTDLLVSKRIVLMFAPSGAGKTSLIHAALIPLLQLRYQLHPLPTVRLTHRNDAVSAQSGVNRYVLSTMRSLEHHVPNDQKLSDEQLGHFTLANYFAHRLGLSADVGKRKHWLLVLDQFEELFTLDSLDGDAKQAFLQDLGNVLAGIEVDLKEATGQAPLTIWALFSMREDRVAELQPFLDLIPTALDFRYRLDLLERDEALEAVVKPAGSYISSDAASRLVDDLRTVQVRTPDGKDVLHQGRFVEPVQLQVVCRQLWDEVVEKEHRPIELGDVTTPKGGSEVDRALGHYFDTVVERAANASQVAQRNLRDWIEECLITATGIRAQALREPASLGSLNDAISSLVDAHLIRSDVRNDREWIELAHDRLVEPVRTGNKAWRQRNLKPFQLQAKLWADTDKTHTHWLFLGEELVEAEQFAAEHPDELNKDELQFLKNSREERDRVSKEKGMSRDRYVIVAALLFLAGVVIAVATQLGNLAAERLAALKVVTQDQEDQTRLYQKVARTREKQPISAIRDLVEVQEEIAVRKSDNLSLFFDSRLREILGIIPASVERELGRHSHIVRSFAFTADGTRLISGSWDGKISIWRPDRPPGTPVFATEDQGVETYAVALHEPTGVLASSYIDGTIALWRLAESRLEKLNVLNRERTGYLKQVTTVGFNRDGTLLATAGWDKTILLWDVSNPNEPLRVASFGSKYHSAPIHRIVFLPPDEKGERLASTDLEGKVRIWRIPERSTEQRIEPRPERDFAVSDVIDRKAALYSAAVSPNGRFLVAGDSEGYVYIWDLEVDDARRSGVRLTKAHHGRNEFDTQIYDIAFSPDGREFASVGVDGVVLRWILPDAPKITRDLRDKIVLLRVGGLGERLFSVIYHPSRAGVVAVGGTRTVRFVDLGRRGSLLATPLVSGDQSTASWRTVSMDNASSTIAASKGDSRILFWRRNADGIGQVPSWTIDAGRGTMFALHPNGSSLVTIACGGKLTIWELLDSKAPVPTVLTLGEAPAASCPAAAPLFSQDGVLFATALGPQLELWSRDTSGVWRRQYVGAFDASSVLEVGGSSDGKREIITSLAINPASDLLAAGGSFGHIRLLEIKSGKPASSFRQDSADAGDDVLSLAFRPDGTRLVSGGENGSISEWSLPALKREWLDTRHERSVTSLAFAVRGRNTSTPRPILISADRDGNVREWTSGTTDVATVQIAPANGRPVRAMALRADGLFLVTAGDELLAWDFSREGMVQVARRFIAAP